MKLEYQDIIPNNGEFNDDVVDMVIDADEFFYVLDNELKTLLYAITAFTSPYCFVEKLNYKQLAELASLCNEDDKIIFHIAEHPNTYEYCMLEAYILRYGNTYRVLWQDVADGKICIEGFSI